MEEFWTIASAASDVVMLLLAVAAAWFAFHELKVGRQIQATSAAYDTYRAYLKMAFENPRYANPDPPKFSNEDVERYHWFVNMAMHAFEQIIDSCMDEEWEITMRNDLEAHSEYLQSDLFMKELPTHSARMQKFVHQINAESALQVEQA